jgi:hypothetical protein
MPKLSLKPPMLHTRPEEGGRLPRPSTRTFGTLLLNRGLISSVPRFRWRSHSAAGGSRHAFQFLATGFTPAITSTAVFSAFPAFAAW